MKFIFLYLFVCFTVTGNQNKSEFFHSEGVHRCVHDEIKHVIKEVKYVEKYLGSTFEPLRILLDYTNLNVGTLIKNKYNFCRSLRS